jgi:hypothetical protein
LILAARFANAARELRDRILTGALPVRARFGLHAGRALAERLAQADPGSPNDHTSH